MTTFVIILAVSGLMIAANALYVAAEFATVSARRTRISQEATAGNRLAKLLQPIMADSQRLDTYVAACQLGITLSSLVLGFYGQSTIAGALAPWLSRLGGVALPAAQSIAATVVLVLLTILQVLLGELVPKSVALRYPERMALFTVVPMRWSMLIFRPLIALFNGTGGLILRLIGVPPASHHQHLHSPEEIGLLVAESTRGGFLEADERQLLRNAFRVGELAASSVMVPRTSLIAAPSESTVDALLELAAGSGYTRIPLYQGTIDSIAGIVHFKDLYRLHLEGVQDTKDILRTVPFVPESKPANEVWNELRERQSYLAVVFDEYGGTAGIITVEDLIEEIFGEVQDEYDEELALIAADPDGRVRVRGDVLVSDVNELIGLRLPEDEAHTIGGLAMSTLERPPRPGDEVRFGETSIRVEVISGQAVREVSITQPQASEQITNGEVT